MPSPHRPFACLTLAVFALGACHRAAPSSHGDQSFMQANAHQKGVTALGDGLQYRIVASGPADGPHPAKDDEVKVDYTGSLVSGSVFESTSATGAPAVLKVDRLIPAWMEVLPKMRPGDEWLVYAPPDLGYGQAGQPPVIPPNSVLVFDLKLLGVLKSEDNRSVKFAGTEPEGPSLQANQIR